MGYHKREIKRGVFGSVSKIREELEELEDAESQGNKILAHCELADLFGALRAVAKGHGLSMSDLESMCNATESSFLDGTRAPAGKQESRLKIGGLEWGVFQHIPGRAYEYTLENCVDAFITKTEAVHFAAERPYTTRIERLREPSPKGL